jgi:NAD(P)-dependent dehydrogenase (short-subunit alcohol dehydrogenase family)
MLGLVGLKPSAGAYCASKGAVVLLTKQIAVEYGIDKIHCNALCPGCKCFDVFCLLLTTLVNVVFVTF